MSTQARAKKTDQRERSIFPTDIGGCKPGEAKSMKLSKGGMADTVVTLLRKHGATKDKREGLTRELKEKFPKASPATLRTQTYRGIVYLRLVGEVKAPSPRIFLRRPDSAIRPGPESSNRASATEAPPGHLSHGLQLPPRSTTVAARLTESDAASLNEMMNRNGFSTLGVMLRTMARSGSSGQLLGAPETAVNGTVNVPGSQYLPAILKTEPHETSLGGPVVQRYERPPRTRKVGGSIPPRSTSDYSESSPFAMNCTLPPTFTSMPACAFLARSSSRDLRLISYPCSTFTSTSSLPKYPSLTR